MHSPNLYEERRGSTRRHVFHTVKMLTGADTAPRDCLILGISDGGVPLYVVGIADIVKLPAALSAILLTGCATFHVEPANQPLPASASHLIEDDPAPSGDDEGLFVGLAFSGGGMRAAAFSYGVLAELDRIQIRSKNSTTRLIDHVDFLSGVSGGAITAAYFGLNGRAALANFKEKFLMRDTEESLSSIFNPMSVAHAYEGGINGSQQFPRWLDDNLFHGATFRQLGPEHRPDRTMSKWRDALVRWRCGLSAEELRQYGASNGSSCRDLRFFVGFVSFDDLGRQRADALNSIPTRFKMAPKTVELVIGAARDALRANATFRAFLSHS